MGAIAFIAVSKIFPSIITPFLYTIIKITQQSIMAKLYHIFAQSATSLDVYPHRLCESQHCLRFIETAFYIR